MKRAVTISTLAITCATAAFGGLAHAADPTTADCLASSESSLKLRSQHKLRDARTQLLVCAAATCPADIREECTRRVAEVNAAMPTIVFEVKDAAGNDLGAVVVTMDGAPLVERLEGIALSIDPGQHTFSFTAAGQPPVKKDLLIREGDKERRERIALGAPALATANSGGVAASGDLVASGDSSSPGHEVPRTRLGTQRIAAIAAAGVGVVGLGLGIAFGLDAMSKHDDAAHECPLQACTTQRGVSLWSDATSAGNWSTVGFVIGAVGVAGAAALWFTAKPASQETPGTQVGLGLGTVQIRGLW